MIQEQFTFEESQHTTTWANDDGCVSGWGERVIVQSSRS